MLDTFPDIANRINEFLKRFGTVPPENTKPRFRLVWSDNEFENRFGEFNVFAGKIFIRSEKGMKKVPKYGYLKERWVIEIFSERAYSSEVPETLKGSYEPIYVFEDKFGRALALNTRVVEIIMHTMFAKPRTAAEIQAADRAIDEARQNAMQQYFEDSLDLSVIQNQLHLGEAIIVPKSYRG